MRDFATKWSPPPDWNNARIEADGLTVSVIANLQQTLLSGRLDAGLAALAPGISISRSEPVRSDPYALRLARDRMLLVSSAPLDVTPGWHDAGYATTAMDDAWQVFQLEGSRLMEMIGRGTTVDPDQPGASAAVRFAGVPVLLYRYQTETRLRLHIEHSLAAYWWRWLETQLG